MSARPHGYARYRLDGCRCYPCATARSAYDDNRTRALIAGTWQPWTDAAPVRTHIEHLRSCSMGLRAIAAAAGVDRKRLQAVLTGRPERGTGPQPKVRPALAAAVLAVEPTLENLAPSTPISPLGTHRRVHALVAVGWPQQYLADHLGMSPGNFCQMLRRPTVLVRRALAVQAMYDALWRQDPTAHGATPTGVARAKAHALAQEWAPVGAWDDEQLDDPEAYPDWTGVCGTSAGVNQHRRHGLPICQPCRDALATHRRAKRAAA
ncbi:hypothetical protein ABZV65_13790 [Streptomyces bauhiniae]|uniref:hypothetical protein n=1 Tax=Streptomyces bauhiniae TaxID=2340725 RepID=UPI0033B17548